MRVGNNNLTRRAKEAVIQGVISGGGVGALTGAFAGASNFALFNANPLFAFGPLLAFSIIFALYGGLMGWLLGLDTRPKSAPEPAMPPAKPENPLAPAQTLTLLFRDGNLWLVVDGE